MADEKQNPPNPDDFTLRDFTQPSRTTVARRPNTGTSGSPAPLQPNATANGAKNPPLLLQHFFDGAVDLDKELTVRFPNMPLISVFRARSIIGKTRSGIASLTTQDASASLLVEVETASRETFFTFTLGGMIGFRFVIAQLSEMDRSHWLEPMRRDVGEIAFLWNQSRWENDYLICSAHRHYTNLFAFSTHHMEAAARLTSEMNRKLVEWIDSMWRV